MANFILVSNGNQEYLLNLDTIVTIAPYESDYDEEDDVKGVMIKHVGEEDSVLYQDLDFKSLKGKILGNSK